MMTLRPILFLAIAIGLYFVSHSLEVRGDAAPVAENGISPERARYHLMALVLLLGALGCFISAGVSAFRNWRG
jgi:hypothetical protein